MDSFQNYLNTLVFIREGKRETCCMNFSIFQIERANEINRNNEANSFFLRKLNLLLRCELCNPLTAVSVQKYEKVKYEKNQVISLPIVSQKITFLLRFSPVV